MKYFNHKDSILLHRWLISRGWKFVGCPGWPGSGYQRGMRGPWDLTRAVLKEAMVMEGVREEVPSLTRAEK